MLKNIFFALIVTLSQFANAQIVSGNAFMKGNYVEVGIGPCGTYGSSIDAPAGYHPRGNGSYTNRLGFVADANKDGWGTGTPNYCGDYFVPGTPEEGFGLQINGVNYNNNLLCSEVSISGSITDYKISGTNILTTWQGQIAGVQITSVTKVPMNDVFFITEVTLKNTSASTINNLYYMRNVDPDNEVTLPGGSYVTNNFVVAENPNSSSRALVSATGLSYGCYLGLGTKDCRARVSWGGFSNRNPADVWNGTGGLSQSGSSTNDIAVSIAFKINSLAPGESASFKFAHVLAASDLERALELTNPSLEVNGIPVADNSIIQVCPGVAVPLHISNGSGFDWTWAPSTGLNETSGSTVNATVSSSQTYVATGTNSCGSTTSLSVTLDPSLTSSIGSVGAITGPTSVCLPSPGQTYSIDPVDNATLYEWTVPSGVSIVGGDGTNQITVSFSSAFSGTITVKARNGCGVSNTSTLAVNGAAAITPNINCPADIAVDAIAGQCGANVNFNATGTGTISYSKAPGSFFPVGTTIVNVTASTACGSANCSFNVTVNDKQVPTAVCKPIEVYLGLDGTVMITPSNVDNGSTDNCGTVNLSVDKTSFTATNTGANTITLTVTDGSGNSSTCQTTVTVKRRPTTLVYNGDGSEQYSDQQVLTAELKDQLTNTVLSSKLISFALGSQSTSGTTNGSGIASSNLIITQNPAPAYTVKSNFAGDGIFLPSSDEDAFDITQEDARAYYSGSLMASTSGINTSTATVTLSATIKDITAVSGDPSFDVFKGDIRNATVTFVNRDNGSILASDVPVGLINLADLTIGTATKNVTLDIGAADAKQFTIGIIVNNYYIRNSSADNTIITVSKPLDNFITGGGYIVLTSQSAGQKAGTPGTNNNFGFNVKYNKSNTNLQGNVNTIIRRMETDGILHVYQIKGNAMTSLAVNSSIATAKTSTFNGKANVQDITNPLTPVSVDGNATLQVTMTDRGEPGNTDDIGITVWNKSGGLWYSSNWNGTKTVNQTLGGGNIKVNGASYNASSSSAATLKDVQEPTTALTEKLELNVFPNPASDQFTITLNSNDKKQAIVLRVTDISGRIIELRKGLQSGQNIKFGQSLGTGSYIIEAIQGSNRQSQMVTKQ